LFFFDAVYDRFFSHIKLSSVKVKCVYYSSVSNTACKSAFKSSISSIPTDNLIKSLVTPVAACSSTDSCWCVVLAGWIISDFVSPMFAKSENIFVSSATVLAASKPPFKPKWQFHFVLLVNILSLNRNIYSISNPGNYPCHLILCF
jgi:hypothetical protein